MSSGTVEEAPMPAVEDESISAAAESYPDDSFAAPDSALLALANEYSGVVFEWGPYKGTSHEIIQRCPWAKDAGAMVLRSVFEAGRIAQEKETEPKEEKQEEQTEEEPEELVAEKQQTSKTRESSENNESKKETEDIHDSPPAEPGAAPYRVLNQEKTPQPPNAAAEPAPAEPEAQQEIRQDVPAVEAHHEGTMQPVNSEKERREPVKPTGKPAPKNKPDIAPAEVKKIDSSVKQVTTREKSEQPPDAARPGILKNSSKPVVSEKTLPETVYSTELELKSPTETEPDAKRTIAEPEKEEHIKETIIEEALEPTSEIEAHESAEAEIYEEPELAAEYFYDEEEHPAQMIEVEEEYDIQPSEEGQSTEFSEFEEEVVEMATPLKLEEESFYELPAPVEQVELAVEELAQFIDELEDEDELDTVHEILDDIATKIQELRSETDDERIPEIQDAQEVEVSLSTEEAADTEEDLRELFIELFDYAEIDYTPELVDSFVRLTLQHDINKLISESAAEESSLVDRGTHEIIQQIIKAIATVKKAARHACSIGRSALNLYSRQLATA
jgi:hypothetical protein